MPSKLLINLQRWQGWRLITLVSVIIVVAVEVIVAMMDVLLKGQVTSDYLITGLVAASLVAPLSLVFINHVLAEFNKHDQQYLERSTQSAEIRLTLAIESAQMIFWELDFTTGELKYDDSKQHWLGINRQTAAHTLSDWLAYVHPDDQAPFMAHFQQVLQNPEAGFDFEYRLQTDTHDWVWVQSRGRVVQRGAQGEPLFAAGGSLNIHARKMAEHALLETQARLQNIFDKNPDIMVISRLADGYITDVNEAFVRASGYSKAEAIGNTTLGLQPWSDNFDRERMTRELAEHGYCGHFEASFHGKNQPPLMGSLVAVVTYMGGIPHILSTVRDISVEKQMEDTLRKTTERYDFATAIGHIGTWDWNPRTDELFWSDETYRLMGYEPHAITPSYALYLDLVHPDDREHLQHDVQAALENQQNYGLDCRIVLGTGKELVCHVTGRVEFDLQGQPIRMLGTIQDITERKRIEQSLFDNSERLKLAMDAAQQGWFDYDLQTGKVCVSPEYIKTIGYDPNHFESDLDNWFASLHEDDREHVSLTLQQCLASGETTSIEYRRRDREGNWIWIHSIGRVTEWDEQHRALRMIGIHTNITQRKQAEEQVNNLATLLRLISDNVPDMIWAKDLNKHFLFANKAICKQLLNARDTDEPIGKDDMFFALRERNAHADNPYWHTFGESSQDSDTLTLQQGKAAQFDEFGNVQGKFLFLDVHKAPLINQHGEVIGVVGSARDVTEQKALAEKLRLASLVLENSSEAMIVTDADNLIVDVNPAFTQLTGYALDEVMGQNPSMLHSERHAESFYRDMWEEINATGRWQGEVWNRRKNGEIYAEWLTINTIHHEDGSVHRRVAMFSDITEKKKTEELIWMQANFDPLTLLPNRRMFHDRLKQDLKKAHRAGLKLGLLYLDLDRFKEVNDTMGHSVGDILLVEAARRITACVRESDTVARLGGDEFTVILAELDDPSCVERITECILHALNQPFELGDSRAYVSASIGITLYPDDASNFESLLKNADQAMYVAKSAGRNRFSYFTHAMQESAQRRLSLLNDLRDALDAQQFELYYQPIVNLATGEIHKAEALIRWFHPQRGLMNPAEFIPLTEESGLIHPIGDWVFNQAAQQALQWRNRCHPDFQISVNKSPVQFQASDTPSQWMQHLQAIDLPGQAIVIEITEGLLLENSPMVTSELLAFRDAGIQVALDDFGTGYSALSYLKKLDIDYVKIDQSFIRNLANDASDMALTEAIVVMAHKLGLKVIAEGIETEAQRNLLVNMGCDYAQGYLYSRPLPAKAFEAFVAAHSHQHP